MARIALSIFIFITVIVGCTPVDSEDYAKSRIVKVIDFELSPDEDKIAFSAITLVGNTDIFVIDIDGANLKKLTFKDRSPSNHIAKFFKKHKWRNFFEINMYSPEWTKEGRIAFCEEITRHHITGVNTAGLIQRTIEFDGSKKRIKTEEDEIARRKPFDPINRPIITDQSEKHKKKIFLEDGILWVLNYDKPSPRKLIQ